jgi:hypothetical protein
MHLCLVTAILRLTTWSTPAQRSAAVFGGASGWGKPHGHAGQSHLAECVGSCAADAHRVWIANQASQNNTEHTEKQIKPRSTRKESDGASRKVKQKACAKRHDLLSVDSVT